MVEGRQSVIMTCCQDRFEWAMLECMVGDWPLKTMALATDVRNPDRPLYGENVSRASLKQANLVNEIDKRSQMTYKEFHKSRWNHLAKEFGGSSFGAVIAEHNDQVNYYFDKTTKRMLRRVLNLDHKSVLDLGCGIGRLSVWLAGKAALVTGVDISEEMIRVARRKAGSEGARNASFAVYDGTALPFEDGLFDVAVCCGVLKYVIGNADFAAIIRDMCRVVKPRGQIVIIDEFHSVGPVELLGEQDIGRLSVLRCPKDYIALCQQHGMELVDQCAMYRKLFQYHAATELQKWQLGRLILAKPSVTRAMANIDVWIDEVMRHRPSLARSFQMLVFMKLS